MFVLCGLGRGVCIAQCGLEPLGLVPLLFQCLLRRLLSGPGLVSLHPGAGQLGLIDTVLIGDFLPEPIRLLPEPAGRLFGGSGLFLGLVPCFESLVQLPDAHVLHIVLNGEPLPLLLVRDGKEAQSLGVGQIPKRLGLCLAAEQALLVAPVLPEHPHEVLRLGGGIVHLVLQILAPTPVGQLGLGLRQPAPDLNGGVEHHPASLVLDGADLRRQDVRRLAGVHGGKGYLRSGGRAAHPKVLTEELTLSYFHFAHAATPFFLGNLGLPFLSRLLPFSSHSSQVSKNSR